MNSRKRSSKARILSAERIQPAALSKRKLWLFRGIMVFGLPLVVLALVELTLRLFGVGYRTDFLLALDKDGKTHLVQNNRFGWRFFGDRKSTRLNSSHQII